MLSNSLGDTNVSIPYYSGNNIAFHQKIPGAFSKQCAV